MFDNYNNILRRIGKFIGKIPCSNLSYHLEDLRQNEGYFLIKGQVSIYLANRFSPGKAPIYLPLSKPPTGLWRRGTREGGIINHLRKELCMALVSSLQKHRKVGRVRNTEGEGGVYGNRF